jgi:sulfopyruvate decarboxylase TPP-binding subunit
MNAPTIAAADAGVLHGLSIIDTIKKARIHYVLSVPDLHTSKGLLMPIAKDPELELIRVCKEDETIGISAGLSYGSKRALILIQYTGFLYAMNAIRGVSVEFKQPTCLMIGMLGLEPGVPPPQSKKWGLTIIEPILDVMGIPHHRIESDADLDKIPPAIDECYKKSFPVAMLICRRPV